MRVESADLQYRGSRGGPGEELREFCAGIVSAGGQLFGVAYEMDAGVLYAGKEAVDEPGTWSYRGLDLNETLEGELPRDGSDLRETAERHLGSSAVESPVTVSTAAD